MHWINLKYIELNHLLLNDIDFFPANKFIDEI